MGSGARSLGSHTHPPPPAPRLEYEARNQKKEAKELALLEAMRQQEEPPESGSHSA